MNRRQQATALQFYVRFAVAVAFADKGAHGKKAPSARELAAKPTEGVQRAKANGVPWSDADKDWI